MYNMINNYMKHIKIEDIDKFAKSKNINLSSEELAFTYTFIQKNYQDILKNPNLFKIDRYQNKYSKENFPKVKKVFTEYFSKYHKFL